MNTVDFFKKNSYIFTKNVLDVKMANYLYTYLKLKAQTCKYTIESEPDKYIKDWQGWFGDGQSRPEEFCIYGDPAFDTLNLMLLPDMEKLTGKKLIPTYTYSRLYLQGAELRRHKDRPSCEISTTLCLGYNISNLSEDKKDWCWSMYVGPSTGELGTPGVPCPMKPGDMIIYKGSDVEHWREKYPGLDHGQVFLHYNEDTPENRQRLYDERPLLGLPASFKVN